MTSRRSPARRGFTLLEVLLALALTVVLLSLLTFSISVYLRASNAGRDDVERSQLARVLLRRMSDDLRSTLWRNEADAASSDSASSSDAPAASGSGSGSTSGSGATSGSQSGSGSGTGGNTGSGSGSGNSSGDSNSSTSVSDSTELPPVTGLFGNQYEVQIDVSRLPRIEQYASAVVTSTDLVSDVKTVAYFCQTATSGVSTSASGLVRREFDRAATSYASTNGDVSAWEQGLAPIAQEVTAVEFRYFDGTEWLTEWDSQAKNALPLAVEIAIQLASSAPPAGATANSPLAAVMPATTTIAATGEIYRVLVFIPQSQAPKISGASAMETMVSSMTSSGAAEGGADGQGQNGQGGANAARGGGSSGRGGGYGNERGGGRGGEGGGRGGGRGGQGGGRGGEGGPGGGEGGPGGGEGGPGEGGPGEGGPDGGGEGGPSEEEDVE